MLCLETLYFYNALSNITKVKLLNLYIDKVPWLNIIISQLMNLDKLIFPPLK